MVGYSPLMYLLCIHNLSACLLLPPAAAATTASKLTMQRLANNIKGRADLPGKKVESWTPYVPLLRLVSSGWLSRGQC